MTVAQLIAALQSHETDAPVLFWDIHGDLLPIEVVLPETGTLIGGLVRPADHRDKARFPIVAISHRTDLPLD